MSEVRAIKRQSDHCGHWVDHEICTEYKWTEELDYNLVTWRMLKCTRCWSPTFLEIRSNVKHFTLTLEGSCVIFRLFLKLFARHTKPH